jgi:heme oxygenase (biliverdin-IX-beta and delta-forming)
MNDVMEMQPTGRWLRLKGATEGVHDGLDKRIMVAKPFASRERYGLFAKVQHAFHREIDALYERPDLKALFKDLESRRRLPLIAQDLSDLGMTLPANDDTAADSAPAMDLPTAVGWLYVAEGSNLGAAFLLKAAGKLGLNEDFGARHLAPAPEGRGLAWRNFTSALDQIPFTPADEAAVDAGASAAFARVKALVEEIMPMEDAPATAGA